MKIYKPIDYLYYVIGKLYEWTNMSDNTYPSIPGMISAIQLFSLNWIIDFLFPGFLNLIYVIGGFAAFLIINFIRYKKDSYYRFRDDWKNVASLEKWIYRVILISYFAFSIYCLTQIMVI